MSKKLKKKRQYASKVGLPPGSIIYVGEPRTGKVKLSEIDFSPAHFDEHPLKTISESKV